MSTKAQIDLRHRLIALIMTDIEKGAVDLVEANAAVAGASATVVACFPEGEIRDKIMEITLRLFPTQVASHATDIRKGRLELHRARLPQ